VFNGLILFSMALVNGTTIRKKNQAFRWPPHLLKKESLLSMVPLFKKQIISRSKWSSNGGQPFPIQKANGALSSIYFHLRQQNPAKHNFSDYYTE
jgi:hypothetical protein